MVERTNQKNPNLWILTETETESAFQLNSLERKEEDKMQVEKSSLVRERERERERTGEGFLCVLAASQQKQKKEKTKGKQMREQIVLWEVCPTTKPTNKQTDGLSLSPLLLAILSFIHWFSFFIFFAFGSSWSILGHPSIHFDSRCHDVNPSSLSRTMSQWIWVPGPTRAGAERNLLFGSSSIRLTIVAATWTTLDADVMHTLATGVVSESNYMSCTLLILGMC